MQNQAIVTFLLDRSGSMAACKAATIEGFNAYLSSLQEQTGAHIDFTFMQFDTGGIDKVCVAIPVRTAKPLTNETYQPRGGTPLIDAAVKTIRAVETALAARKDSPRVVICIQTDGHENSSREHTWEELRGIVGAKQEMGWQFNFMGAGIDAYHQGRMMGIGIGDTVSYDSMSRGATVSVFTASAVNASNFASGVTANASYTMAQKSAAGDTFDPLLNQATTVKPQPGQAVPDITLTKGA